MQQEQDQFWGISFGGLNDNRSKQPQAATFSLKINMQASEPQGCHKQIFISLEHINEGPPLWVGPLFWEDATSFKLGIGRVL